MGLSRSLFSAAKGIERQGNDCADEVKAQKRAKTALLHEDYLVPISFLKDPMKNAQSNSSFKLIEIGGAFGNVKEAYAQK